jgi:hypothetical protein
VGKPSRDLISETGNSSGVVKVVKSPVHKKEDKIADRDEVSMNDLSENQIRKLIRNMIS